jgi:hypothetical protein
MARLVRMHTAFQRRERIGQGTSDRLKPQHTLEVLREVSLLVDESQGLGEFAARDRVAVGRAALAQRTRRPQTDQKEPVHGREDREVIVVVQSGLPGLQRWIVERERRSS